MNVDDETLMAFADGELSEARAAEVAAAVAADPALAARVERFRAVRSRLAGALDGARPPADAMARAQRAQSVRAAARPRIWGSAIAASVAGLAMGVAATLSLQPGRADLGDSLQAQGDLAAALDSLPSGAAKGPVAALYTVVAADGRPCRAFRMRDYEGVACRERGDWRVLALAQAPRRAGGFAPASGDEPAAIAAAVDALEPGDPLSPQAEQARIAARWRE